MTHLSLFTGIGGLDLAAEMAGFRTVAQCEWAEFQTKVLEKHWPDVPRWKDIKSLNKQSFFEKTGLETVDVVSGGFPCQPFSTAGKRMGINDERYLWPEMLRVIREIKPNWVVGENVAGIISMALDDILVQLEKEGYEARAFVFPASAVGALHKRNRVAIVAHTCRNGWTHEGQFGTGKNASRWENLFYKQTGRNSSINSRTKQLGECKNRTKEWEDSDRILESGICRVVDGIPDRLDRLVSLGNAVVPQQFYPIFKAIYEIENMECYHV